MSKRLLGLAPWFLASLIACGDSEPSTDAGANDTGGPIPGQDASSRDAQADATVRLDATTNDASRPDAQIVDAGDTCGDTVQDPNETCDEGARNTDVACDPGTTSCTYCNTDCVLTTVEAEVTVPVGSGRWTEHLENDGADLSRATGATCDTSALKAFSGCFHAGELRWVTVPNRASCAGLTATDALGAFDWRCVEVAGNARMISTGLRDGFHLSGLIDFANVRWRTNSVTISDATGPIHTSAPSTWWSNPIVDVTTSSTVQNSWDVNIVRQAGDYEFHLEATHATLVVQPGVVLGYSPDLGNNRAVLANRDFFWIEGHWRGALGSREGIHVASAHRGVIRNARAENFGEAGFDFRNSRALRVEYAASGRNTDRGFFFVGMQDSVFRHLRASRNQGFGLELSSTNRRNAFSHIVVSNQQFNQPRPGISVSNSGNQSNSWAHVLSFNNAGDGVDTGCDSCVFQNVSTVSNLRDGFRPRGGDSTYMRMNATANGWNGFESPGTNSQYIDVHSTLNARFGFDDMAREGSAFHGRFSAVGNSYWDSGSGNDLSCVSGNIRLCAVGCPAYQVSSPGSCCNECYLPNSMSANPPPTSYGITENTNTQSCEMDQRTSTAQQALPNVDLTLGGYVGRAVDMENPQGNVTWVGPPGSSPADNVTDWLSFEYWFRGWGNMGCHAAPDCSQVGPCSDTLEACRIAEASYSAIGAACQVWDFALIKTKADAILQQPLPNGDTVQTHSWGGGLDAEACGRLHPGSVHDGTDCVATFVNRATELSGDGLGNENHLCESGEVCVWTPYPAAYQGHGALIPTESSPGVPYVFVDGTVSGVVLLRHAESSFDVSASL